MIPFGIFGIVSDQLYLKALKSGELAYLKSAKYLFPFDREILVSEALLLIRNKIDDKPLVYKTLKDALYYDPYSAEMLGMYVQYAAIFGNRNEATIAYNTMKKIVPNSNSFKQLKQIRDTTKGF